MSIALQQSLNTSSDMSNGGSGQFSVLRGTKAAIEDQSSDNPFNRKDKIMRFKNSRDPVYIAFEAMEKQSISTLAKDFIKDSFFDTIQMISKVMQ